MAAHNEFDAASATERTLHPVAFPLAPPPTGTVLVLLLPENRPLSDAERAELRVARASFAASGIPERGAPDLLTVAETTTVSTITTWLLTTGSSALRTLFDRFDDLRLAVPVEKLTWTPSLVANSLDHLPVTFTAATPATAG